MLSTNEILPSLLQQKPINGVDMIWVARASRATTSYTLELTFKYFGKVLILMPFNRSFEFECAVCSFLHFLELSKYKPIEELLAVEDWL